MSTSATGGAKPRQPRVRVYRGQALHHAPAREQLHIDLFDFRNCGALHHTNQKSIAEGEQVRRVALVSIQDKGPRYKNFHTHCSATHHERSAKPSVNFCVNYPYVTPPFRPIAQMCLSRSQYLPDGDNRKIYGYFDGQAETSTFCVLRAT